jgi:hypothetical protein
MAKNFLYKIIFPFLGLCYVGRAKTERRYQKQNKLGERFLGPHHNVDVESLLQDGECAFWVRVKEFETQEELIQAEHNYLDKVWPSGTLRTRPSWLLNRRSRHPLPQPGWNHTKESKRLIGLGSQKRKGVRTGRQSKEAIESRWSFDYAEIWRDVEKAMGNSTSYHWGGAEIAKKHKCTRRFIAKVSKMIREGKNPEEWIPS